jgi:hypothetical protein
MQHNPSPTEPEALPLPDAPPLAYGILGVAHPLENRCDDRGGSRPSLFGGEHANR